MANSATCWLEIKCSDNKALLEELKRRGYVESVYDDKKDEASDESEVDGICLDFPATGLCTGAGDCCLAKEGNDTLGFNGGMKWEFKITNEDIKVLKEAA
ncbi:MAG: hypothetical protein J6X55_09465, partial [Victivallales bacterium]|nr:hypothetical protein [Victivallales bacterium]